MVVRYTDIHHWFNDNVVFHNHWSPVNGPCAKNRTLGLINNWNKEKRSFEPQVTEGTETFLAFWCSGPDQWMSFRPDEWMDEQLVQMLPVMGD